MRGARSHLHPATATARIMSDMKAFKRSLLLVAASCRSIIPIVPPSRECLIRRALVNADSRLGYYCFQKCHRTCQQYSQRCKISQEGNPENNPDTIVLVGEPGVGKTSFLQFIANALTGNDMDHYIFDVLASKLIPTTQVGPPLRNYDHQWCSGKCWGLGAC